MIGFGVANNGLIDTQVDQDRNADSLLTHPDVTAVIADNRMMSGSRKYPGGRFTNILKCT